VLPALFFSLNIGSRANPSAAAIPNPIPRSSQLLMGKPVMGKPDVGRGLSKIVIVCTGSTPIEIQD